VKTLAFCGFKDKRIWLYAVIKSLAQIYNVKIVTNSPYFKSLNPDYDFEYEMAGCAIQVVKDDYSNLDELIEIEGFNYVIYDCVDNLPDYLDYVVILDNLHYYEDLLEPFDQSKMKIYRPVAGAAKDPLNIIQSVPASQVVALLEKIEETRNISYVSTNGKVTMSMISMLSDLLEVPAKELMKFLKRKKPIIF